jgi:hypothetical protein
MIRISRQWLIAVFVLLGAVSQVRAQEQLIQIYVVRHPETEAKPADLKAIHLSDTGRQRAALLIPTLASVRVSHLFASHTLRTHETLEDLARDRSLPIVQLPQRGTTWKGQTVTDEMSRQEAIDPIADALLALAPGSTAVAALNSDNIFGVLNRLGIPAPPAGGTCATGQVCVPCLNNTCFPSVFDRIWYIALRPGAQRPLVFLELRYGVGWAAIYPAAK